MKSMIYPLALAMVAVLMIPTDSQAKTLDDVYREAVAAFDRGDLDAAQSLVNIALSHDPAYVPARSLQSRIQAKRKVQGKGDPLKDKCRRVIIPEVSFEDEELGNVTKVLVELSKAATGGEFQPNFILDDEVRSRKISLEIRRAPLSQILVYVGSLAKVEVKYEEFAVVITPRATASTTSAPPVQERVEVLPAPINPFEKR